MKESTMNPETIRTPLDAYMENRAAALALLERIAAALENHDDAAADQINWTHAGDMAETRKSLQALADRLFAEGEYAPTSS
jgi:hypothetical protein